MRRSERGVVLLEVIVALAILATTGLAMMALVQEAMATQQRVRDRERELAAADRILVAYSMLSRTDLDIRLGRRDVGEFTVTVQRPEPELYRAAVAPVSAPDHALLVTVLYRAQPQ
jgi:hypothetical protein